MSETASHKLHPASVTEQKPQLTPRLPQRVTLILIRENGTIWHQTRVLFPHHSTRTEAKGLRFPKAREELSSLLWTCRSQNNTTDLQWCVLSHVNPLQREDMCSVCTLLYGVRERYNHRPTSQSQLVFGRRPLNPPKGIGLLSWSEWETRG